ncbi:formylglycine-generating enzyme family protein [Erythrobacter donghaensis]|uniref:formylglycine-generating enzyme family protein n=1 Tax=Erythrobacter donghaensis TaxID=267135 RepID=UPI000A5665CF|nr:SUMF1/EgtB/PvdO family nonheme iron enzyme [Erythrobacter donghaensis]
MANKRRRSSRIAGLWASAIASGYLFAFSTPAYSKTQELGFGSSSQSSENVQHLQIGDEFQPCDGCPTFVRVPAAPADLRNIRFVSKFELTWRNYLQAVKDGSCTVSNPNRPPFRKPQPDLINAHLDRLEIDWPITVLGPDDVECYIKWLEQKMPLDVEVPTHDEWKWFASSGRPSVRYPWGNDPGQAEEALTGLEGQPFESYTDARRPNGSDLTGREHYFYARYLHALKVGQFPPSPWGLHDLMGNASELTANVEPYIRSDGKADGSYRVITAGGGLIDKRWVEEGVNLKTYTIASDGQYSTYSSVRLVLL